MVSNTSQITFIGLGNMGEALAKAQLQAGARITMWNRTPGRSAVSNLVAAGGAFESNLNEAIQASPIAILRLMDYASVQQILTPLFTEPGHPLRGKTIIHLTDGTPHDARELCKLLYSHGIKSYIDGASWLAQT